MFGPVSADRHDTILGIIPVAGCIVGILIVAILGSSNLSDVVIGLVIYAVAVLLLYQLVCHLVLVRCNRPGCPGFMRREVIRRSDGTWVRYRCDAALHVTEKLVSTPNEGPPSPLD